MAMGFQTFVAGTSLDVLNQMDYTFVVDVFDVGQGNGSRGYNIPGFSLGASMSGTSTSVGPGSNQASVSVSGQTVNWSNVGVNGGKIYVIGTPVATLNYFGFSLNDYDRNQFKMAPDFTPLNLCQVHDLVPGSGQVLQTNVPANRPFVAFHRCLDNGEFGHVFWDQINQNGYWSLRFRTVVPSSQGMRATRIYVFSDIMVNIPSHGFFLYRPGTTDIVWHSNCLPLNMVQGAITGSNVPVATTPGISVIVSIPQNPSFPEAGYRRHNCYGARAVGNGQYESGGGDLFMETWYSGPAGQPPPANIAIGPPASIRTDIYDAYFRNSLG